MRHIEKAINEINSFYKPGLIDWIIEKKNKLWDEILKLEDSETEQAMQQMIVLYRFCSQERGKDMPVFDFQNVPTDALIEEGKYVAQVVYSKLKQTKQGDDMFSIKLRIMDGIYKGVEIWDNLVCTQASLGRLKSACDSMKITKPNVKEMVEINAEDFMNRVCDLNVETIDMGNGIKKSGLGWNGYIVPEEIANVTGSQAAVAAQPPSPPAQQDVGTGPATVSADRPAHPAQPLPTAQPVAQPVVEDDFLANLSDDDIPF